MGGCPVGLVVDVVRLLRGDRLAVGEERAKLRFGFFLLADVEPDLGKGRLQGKVVGTDLALMPDGLLLGGQTHLGDLHRSRGNEGVGFAQQDVGLQPTMPRILRFVGAGLRQTRHPLVRLGKRLTGGIGLIVSELGHRPHGESHDFEEAGRVRERRRRLEGPVVMARSVIAEPQGRSAPPIEVARGSPLRVVLLLVRLPQDVQYSRRVVHSSRSEQAGLDDALGDEDVRGLAETSQHFAAVRAIPLKIAEMDRERRPNVPCIVFVQVEFGNLDGGLGRFVPAPAVSGVMEASVPELPIGRPQLRDKGKDFLQPHDLIANVAGIGQLERLDEIGGRLVPLAEVGEGSAAFLPHLRVQGASSTAFANAFAASSPRWSQPSSRPRSIQKRGTSGKSSTARA